MAWGRVKMLCKKFDEILTIQNMEETSMSVEDTVRKIVTRIVRPTSEFTRETTFKEMGADSLDIVRILSAIEDKYDIEMEDDALADVKDMGGFVDYIERKISEKDNIG